MQIINEIPCPLDLSEKQLFYDKKRKGHDHSNMQS